MGISACRMEHNRNEDDDLANENGRWYMLDMIGMYHHFCSSISDGKRCHANAMIGIQAQILGTQCSYGDFTDHISKINIVICNIC